MERFWGTPFIAVTRTIRAKKNADTPSSIGVNVLIDKQLFVDNFDNAEVAAIAETAGQRTAGSRIKIEPE